MESSKLKNIFINPQHTLQDAIDLLDKTAKGILLVVENDDHLTGTITDGDIRRAILNGIPLGIKITDLLSQKKSTIYPKPITGSPSATKNDLLDLMKKNVLRHIPIIDENQKVVDLVLMDDLLPSENQFPHAVILAGGPSRRLHPLAADLPKPMLPVGNKPLLEFTVNKLREAGFDQVHMTTHYKSEEIINYFGDGEAFNVKINYINENEPSGTAGALSNFSSLNKPLLVINGDVLTKINYREMLNFHQDNKADMTVAVRLHEFNIPYGVIDASDFQIKKITEKPSFQKFINAGAYLINPHLIESIPNDKPYDMTDFINNLVDLGKKVITFPVHEYWHDIKEYEDYQQVKQDVENGTFEEIASTLGSLEPGTPPPAGFIPLCVPEIRGNEWFYIKECLDTNWVSSVGPFVDRFERMVAEFTGNKFGVATSSGTAALHIALLVAGIKPDDEVILPTLTFIAPANAVRYVGAWPVFIDVEPDYWQMDPKKLEHFLEENCYWDGSRLINKNTGRRIKAMLPVHILGHPCKMDEILSLARKFNLSVIEDATESLGAKFMGEPVGHLGDIACFSFNGNKLITTGGGGMIVTDNEDWAKKAKYLTTQAKDDPLEYIHNEIGYNYRLTNVLAAFGCAQMEQLPEYINKKREIAKVYEENLIHTPGITTMKEAPWAFSVFWMYTILINKNKYGMGSRDLLKSLANHGVQTRPLWHPLHMSHVFDNEFHPSFPISENINSHAISLPCSVGLCESEQISVINTIIKLGNN